MGGRPPPASAFGNHRDSARSLPFQPQGPRARQHRAGNARTSHGVLRSGFPAPGQVRRREQQQERLGPSVSDAPRRLGAVAGASGLRLRRWGVDSDADGRTDKRRASAWPPVGRPAGPWPYARPALRGPDGSPAGLGCGVAVGRSRCARCSVAVLHLFCHCSAAAWARVSTPSLRAQRRAQGETQRATLAWCCRARRPPPPAPSLQFWAASSPPCIRIWPRLPPTGQRGSPSRGSLCLRLPLQPGVQRLVRRPIGEPPVLAEADPFASTAAQGLYDHAFGLEPVLLPRDAESLVATRGDQSLRVDHTLG